MKERKKPTVLVDLSVADDVHQILEPCPSVGEGVHNGILGAVSQLALLDYSPEYLGRRKDNVLTLRKYVLTEMDISPVYWNWEMALKYSRADHIDVQAGIILHLRDLGIFRLATVVWSSSKSMHAYCRKRQVLFLTT